MSATTENSLKLPESLGIIAGGGSLPLQVYNACKDQGVAPFMIAFEGQTDPETIEGTQHMVSRLGAAGSVIKMLKSKNISDLVMIGSIRRPTFAELKPDLKTAEFYAKEGLNALGDDGLLKSLKRFLEKEGFTIHGAQKFLPNSLMPEGALARTKPNKTHQADIERGIEVLKMLGKLDIGQSVVVQQGFILGVEAAEGTDALIKRCGEYKRKGSAPVLIKLCKEGQDQDIDLPTFGAQTVQNLIDAGFAGMAAHTGQSFIVDADQVSVLADSHKIFIFGVQA